MFTTYLNCVSLLRFHFSVLLFWCDPKCILLISNFIDVKLNICWASVAWKKPPLIVSSVSHEQIAIALKFKSRFGLQVVSNLFDLVKATETETCFGCFITSLHIKWLVLTSNTGSGVAEREFYMREDSRLSGTHLVVTSNSVVRPKVKCLDDNKNISLFHGLLGKSWFGEALNTNARGSEAFWLLSRDNKI